MTSQYEEAAHEAASQVQNWEVSDLVLPNWLLDASGEGARRVLKWAKALRLGQDSEIAKAAVLDAPAGIGQLVDRKGTPLIRFFVGAPAEHIKGTASTTGIDVWISAETTGWEQSIKSAAHEVTHALGIREEREPRLLGELAVLCWKGVPIYPYRGRVDSDWLPSEVKHVRDLHPDALVLEYNDGELWSLRNANHSNGGPPMWVYR